MNKRLMNTIADASRLNADLMTELGRCMKRRFLQQRINARKRGVQWDLTFEQWRDWWLATGHIDNRGRQRGQWVMARYFDSGPYQLGNIQCLPAEINVKHNNELRPR